MTAIDDVRVEVAFSTDPNTTTPSFVDMSSRARMDVGIDITRGRQEESDGVQAGQVSLTLDNTDGALTPDLASSPYYPNVLPQNRVRVTYRDPAVGGNLVSANAASIETSAADWGSTTGFGAYTLCTVAQSAVRAWDGTKSLLITWPTTAGGSLAVTTVSGLVIGRVYTFSMYVWAPTGTPNVQMTIALIANGTATPVKDAWQRISVTWTATQSTIQVGPRVTGSTAGQTCYADGFQADEGASVRTFTTTPAPIEYRFDGYVDEWPTEWPFGGQTESTSSITAVDLQSRIQRERSLDSVIAETVKLSDPLWYFVLSEPDSSTTAGDRMGTGATLAVTQVGTGGTFEFAAGTGPGTDGTGAPMLTPASSGNGKYLRGSVEPVPWFATGITLEAAYVSTTSGRIQTVARWADAFGIRVALETNSTGKIVATFRNVFDASKNITVTSTNSYNDGRTHDAALTLSNNGAGTVTLTLYLDGISRGSGTYTTTSLYVPAFSELWIGGVATDEEGDVFAGTLSHVAGIASALAVGDLQERDEAVETGFSGERSDERIARIASWVGIPTGLQALDAGQSTIAHVESTGLNAWDYMQQVATTEAGLLFVSTDGMLTFYDRSHSYDVAAAVAVSVDAELVGPDTRISKGMADVANDVTVDRTGGATARVTDATSIGRYRTWPESLTLISDSDADAFDRAHWILATRAEPVTRLPELTLDGLTDATTSPDVRTLDLDDRVEVTGMPSQSPTPTFDLRVQGYRESISRSGWFVTANLSPYLTVSPLILDDLVYGELDADNRLVY